MYPPAGTDVVGVEVLPCPAADVFCDSSGSVLAVPFLIPPFLAFLEEELAAFDEEVPSEKSS